jgi:CheY-like chemotaxis protein
LADDQAMDRAGMRKLLEEAPDFRVVGEARSGVEAVELCRSLRPDVLILDTRMPELDGVTAIPLVRAASPGTKVIAVAEHGEARCLVLNPPRPGEAWNLGDGASRTHVTDCLQLAVAQGALGAIRRSAEPEQLYRAVMT